jgi:hypothetical protein
MTHATINTTIMSTVSYDNLTSAEKVSLLHAAHVTHWPEYPGFYFCLEKIAMARIYENARKEVARHGY